MKKLLTLALTIGAASTLSACGAKAIEVKVLDEFTEGKNVTITFAHVSDDDSVYEALATEFETKYPNVTVKLHYVDGSYSALSTYIEDSIIDQKQPNITIGYANNFVEYMEGYKGTAVAELNQFMDHEKWGFSDADMKDFEDAGFWNDNDVYDDEGTIYSLSLSKSTEALYIDSTYLTLINDNKEEAGYTGDDLTTADVATWDGVFKVCTYLEKLNKSTAPLNNWDFKNSEIPFEIHHDTPANFALTIFGQNNAAYLSQGSFDFVDDSKNTSSKAAIQSVVAENASYIKPRSGSTYGSSLLSTYVDTEEDDDGEEYDVTTLPSVWANIGSSSPRTYYSKVSNIEVLNVPQMTTDTNSTDYTQWSVLQGPSMCLLANEDQDENLAAWLFMKHLTDTASSTKIALNSGYMPVRQTSFESTEFTAWLNSTTGEEYADEAKTIKNEGYHANYNPVAIAACRVGMAQSSTYYGLPVFIGSNEARNEAGDIVSNVLSGKTVAEAFKIAKENLALI